MCLEDSDAVGMIDVMSTVVGPLPPRSVDEDHGKVTRAPGVLDILKTATAVKPQLMTPSQTAVFLQAEQKHT